MIFIQLARDTFGGQKEARGMSYLAPIHVKGCDSTRATPFTFNAY